MMGQQQINIKPEDTKPVSCNACGGMVFQDCFAIRTVSAIISPTGQEEAFRIPVPVCIQCGRPLYDEVLKEEENGSDD